MVKTKTKVVDEMQSIQKKLESFDTQVRDMADKQAELKTWRGEIISEKSDIESKDLFEKLKKLVNGYIKLDQDFDVLKDLLMTLSKQDEQWAKRWEQQNRALLFIELGKTLNMSNSRDLTMPQLIRQITQINQGKSTHFFENLK